MAATTATQRTLRATVLLPKPTLPKNILHLEATPPKTRPHASLPTRPSRPRTDQSSGYDGLYLAGAATATAGIVEVACNAHARRKFYEARGSDALGAHQALAYYRQLYELESVASRNSFDETQRLRMRRELALPILERFRL